MASLNSPADKKMKILLKRNEKSVEITVNSSDTLQKLVDFVPNELFGSDDRNSVLFYENGTLLPFTGNALRCFSVGTSGTDKISDNTVPADQPLFGFYNDNIYKFHVQKQFLNLTFRKNLLLALTRITLIWEVFFKFRFIELYGEITFASMKSTESPWNPPKVFSTCKNYLIVEVLKKVKTVKQIDEEKSEVKDGQW